jgi:hypothetical protein
MNATARQNASSSAADINLQPLLDLFTTWTQNLFALQRAQIDAVGSWQASITAMHQELWDEWVSRWAGGVPLDG